MENNIENETDSSLTPEKKFRNDLIQKMLTDGLPKILERIKDGELTPGDIGEIFGNQLETYRQSKLTLNSLGIYEKNIASWDDFVDEFGRAVSNAVMHERQKISAQKKETPLDHRNLIQKELFEKE